MVLDYYHLREEPFGVTPDSRYLFASATHREALASLLYGVEAGRGFVALIAKPGMGKTTLLFHALHRLQDKARLVFLFQTLCTPVDFLRALLADLGVHETGGSLIELQVKLNDVLAEHSRSGKPLVVVIDEAQNLDESVLELVRMLSNFETSREKLLQVVLSGQPQLAEKLASPELVQLRQRISIVACLKPFLPEETALYIDHRLRTAGYSFDAPLFTQDALALIAESSEGIPRNINNLCFNALSLGCALRRRTVDRDIVREVIADLDLEPLRERTAGWEESGAQKRMWRLAAWARKNLIKNPAKSSVPAGSGLVPAVGKHSMLAGRLRKLAVAGAIVLALSGVLFQSLHVRKAHFPGDGAPVPEAAVQANGVVPPLVPTDGPAPGVEGRPAASEIRVTPGQTLYRICVENFGSCSLRRLQEIHRLNPWLSDLDHIESGQRIRIPAVRKLSEATPNIVGQPGNVSPAERGTQ